MPLSKVFKVSTGSSEKGTKRNASFTYHTFPETLEEATHLLGEAAVWKEFQAHFVHTLQGTAGRYLQALESVVSPEQYSVAVQECMDGWKYGENRALRGRKPKDPLVAFGELWQTLGDEAKAELAAKYGFGPTKGPADTSPELEEVEPNTKPPTHVRTQRMAGSQR